METSGDVGSVMQSMLAIVHSSVTFSLLLGFLGLYCIVLLCDIVLLLVLRPIGGDLKKGFFGSKERPLSFSWQLRREWNRIEKLIGSGEPSSEKLAVLQADIFVDKMLSEMGYIGNSLGGKFDVIPSGHFRCLPALREAHEVRNRIVLERDTRVDVSEAKRILKLYRSFLEEAEILS